ncbi:MAG TPA: class E sortase [Conexibacter sp.]|jgi:sortase A
MRRALRAISTVLIIAGALLITDAAVTLAWQEPVSALLAHRQQTHLAQQLDQIEQRAPTPVQRRVLARLGTDSRRIAFLARTARREAVNGQPFGRIVIPKIGVNIVTVQGTDADDLRKGPGHYPATTFPGLNGTVAIAGHRTTYLAPFRKVDELKPGDPIYLDMPYGRFTYAVKRTQIVTPDAIWVTRDVGHEQLVLSACHPLYSASHRIIIFADLVSSRERGPTAQPGSARASVG